ncbi:MAG: hypothetical protein ACYTXY_39345, partial [Nostoc sp.]
ISENDVASVSGGNFTPPNKTTSFPKTPSGLSEHQLGSVSGGAVPDESFGGKNKNFNPQGKTPNGLSEHELGSVSGGAVPDESFGGKNKNFNPQGKTPNELSEHELGAISGGGVVTDVLDTTKNLVLDTTKAVTDLV